MNAPQRLVLVLGCLALTAGVEAQGVLDRLKRKLDETRSEVQEARNDAEAATRADERLEAAAEGAIPSADDVANRAAGEIERTEAVQGVRELQRDAHAVATADQRAAAAVDGEIARTEREVEAAVDIEGRARRGIDATEAAAAAHEVERDVDAAVTADERAEREIERQRAEIERSLRLD